MRTAFQNVLTSTLGLAIAFATVAAFAQQRPQQGQRPNQPPGRAVTDEGAIEGLSGSVVQIKGKDAQYFVNVIPQSKVTYVGTAEVDFLKPMLHITLTGDIDEEGKLQADVAELEIFTPQGPSGLGVFNAGADAEAKPILKPAAGNYLFKGKLLSIKEGEITVMAGPKKITGKLASNASIKVNLNELSYAQIGDTAKLKGFELPQPRQQQQQRPYPQFPQQNPANAQNPAAQQPAAPAAPKAALAEELTITGSKPLTSPKKGRSVKSAT